MHCTSCGAPLAVGAAFCPNCGSAVAKQGPAQPASAQAPPAPAQGPPAPPAPYGAQPGYAPPAAGATNTRTIAAVLGIVFILILVGIGIAVLSGGSFGGAGDCVYTFEGVTSRYPNYSEAECDAFCADIRYAGCWWDPYLIRP